MLQEMEPQSVLLDKAYTSTMVNKLNQLRLDNVLTDVNLATGLDVIPCHKVVLAAGCQYFQTMFTSGLRETSSDAVTISNMENNILQTIVDYLYTGELTVNCANVQNLVHSSDLMGLSKIKKVCEQFMLTHTLRRENCIELYKFSGIYQMEHLRMKSHTLMLSHFKDVTSGVEFKQMTEAELIDYITDPQLNISDESHVFNAIVQWVNHSMGLRKHCFVNLVQEIPLHRCPLSFLQDVVMKEPLMKNPKCEECLLKVLGTMPRAFTFDNISPREGFMSQKRIVVGGGHDKDSNVYTELWTMEGVDKTLQWEPCQTLPRVGVFCSVCQTEKQLMITGGHGSQKQACCFNTLAKTWNTLPDMTDGRFRHMSVAEKNAIFVFGGDILDGQAIASVEHLDLTNLKWEHKAMLPQPLVHSVPVKHAGHIYLFGGLGTNRKHLRSMFAYNISMNGWKELPKMPEVCSLGAAIVVDDTIYIVGGFSKTCMSFKPCNNQWNILSRPFSRHADCSAMLWNNNCILLSGGRCMGDSQSGTDDIEEYNIHTDSWKMWSNKLPRPLWAHFMAYMDVWVDSPPLERP